jgi:alpha-L-fucosidase
MYIEGDNDYAITLSTTGIRRLSASKTSFAVEGGGLRPERLMALYKAAGARYFVSMGVHHDNFDLWDSAFHKWNAVRMGPHRDIVGAWKRAALAQG